MPDEIFIVRDSTRNSDLAHVEPAPHSSISMAPSESFSIPLKLRDFDTFLLRVLQGRVPLENFETPVDEYGKRVVRALRAEFQRKFYMEINS